MTRITIRRKDGSTSQRFRVAVTMPDGRRVWRQVATQKAADRERDRLVEARELDLDPTRQTVEGYLRSWIGRERDAKRRRIRERTLIGYERIIEGRIVGTPMGRLTLDRLTKRKVQAWLDAQEGSAATVRNAHAVLRLALARAAGDVIPSNPAVGVELPRKEKFEGAPLTADEVRRLLEATAGDRLAALWRLAIVTGLREGELLGLPRDALDGSTLVVEHQLQRIGGRWVLSPTKSARALQRIALDEDTVRVVRAHLVAMAAERRPRWRYHGLMFVTRQGEPYHQSTVLAEFRAACERAGIAPRRFHDLRLSAATLLRDLGISEDTRMARLGHSTRAMARHYAHASETLDREAVEALARAIG